MNADDKGKSSSSCNIVWDCSVQESVIRMRVIESGCNRGNKCALEKSGLMWSPW